jgi:hypothetical protein
MSASAKRVRPTMREIYLLRGELEAMHRRAQSAESTASIARSDAARALQGARSAGADAAAMRKRADVRQAARIAALASCRAMMDFSARVAPMIMEGAPREDLIALVEECSAMRFREERRLRAEWSMEMQRAFEKEAES